MVNRLEWVNFSKGNGEHVLSEVTRIAEAVKPLGYSVTAFDADGLLIAEDSVGNAKINITLMMDG